MCAGGMPPTGRIYKLRLDNLRTSNVFKKGHRIRVQISSAFFPHFSRNLQTGESEIFSSRMRKAKVRIYHDGQHPSRVVLPVVRRWKTSRAALARPAEGGRAYTSIAE